MKSIRKIFIACVIGLGIAGAVFAFPGTHGHGMHGTHFDLFAEYIATKLDLNADQLLKFEAVRTKMATFRRDKQTRHQRNRAQIAQLITAPILDQQALINVFDSKLVAMREALPETVAVVADFTDSLTTLQKQELEKILAKHLQRSSSRPVR